MAPRKLRLVTDVVTLTLLGYSSLSAESIMTLHRLEGRITLDGFSNEPAWQLIDPLDVIMHQPTFGNEPTERTEIRVGYDDDYLYVSGRLFDSDPEGIQDGGLNRDNLSPSSDYFGIILDTFSDNEINTDRHRLQPALPFTDTRTILIKYATTFQSQSLFGSFY